MRACMLEDLRILSGSSNEAAGPNISGALTCREEILPAVLKAVKNPRSTLSKSGLMAAGDLFTFCGSAANISLKDMVRPASARASPLVA